MSIKQIVLGKAYREKNCKIILNFEHSPYKYEIYK